MGTTKSFEQYRSVAQFLDAAADRQADSVQLILYRRRHGYTSGRLVGRVTRGDGYNLGHIMWQVRDSEIHAESTVAKILLCTAASFFEPFTAKTPQVRGQSSLLD